jgi:hopanoid biosynthesis associated RND transporter like protein HpnN
MGDEAVPRDPASALGSVVVALVGFTLRRVGLVLAALLAVTAACVWLTVARFELDSDVTKLFPETLPWRAAELAIDRAFPQRNEGIAVVIDGQTASATDQAAQRLADALRARPELFPEVRRPDAGEYWDRHALLYLSTDEVRQVTERLIEAQPLLGTLWADPSLRGVAEMARLMALGLNRNEPAPGIAPPLRALSDAAEAATEGRLRTPDWQRLLTNREPQALELRRFVLVRPALDYGQLTAGSAATDTIRATARELNLEAEHGVRLRLTGQIPMADEEFATVSDGAVTGNLVAMGLLALMLWMGLRSWRLIWPLLVLVVVGLAWTAAFGILAVGAFNPLSIAFAVLFIGLGVDFGIQLSVQYRAENAALRAEGQGVDTRLALARAARVAGPGMTLASLACAGSFLAFLPTDYRGVAELGLISGVGMVIGWFLAMTLLPALMVVAKPRVEAQEVGYPALRPLDEWLSRRAALVALLAAGLLLAGVASLAWLRFDTNPVNLRDPQSESVSTWRDLARSLDTNPNTLDVLARDLAAADALAPRLAALPEVGRATTLSSLLPERQAEKLALIEDAALLMGIPPQPRPAPSDAEAAAALFRAATELRAVRGDAPEARDARRLGQALANLAAGPEANRAVFDRAVMPGLNDTLRRVRALLSAQEVTPETLPAELRAEWIAADGRARIEVAPKLAGDDTAMLNRFARAVLAVAPDATGAAVSAMGSSATIQEAFLESGALAAGFVLVLLWWVLRSLRLSLLALAPLALAGLMTLAHCALFGPDLNLANIIALPLLFGMGVAYDIYYVAAWQQGRRDLLASPLNRAVIYSAITNAAAFLGLAVSPHPGTASMGVVLSVSLVYSLLCVMLLLPPLLKLFSPQPKA